MTSEQVLDKNIMIECGKRNLMCFHCNVGSVQTWDKATGELRMFRTGLPVGWPDLMILSADGRVCYCETKIHPRKPTQDQVKMLKLLNSRGFLAFVAYTVEEFTSEVDKWLTKK